MSFYGPQSAAPKTAIRLNNLSRSGRRFHDVRLDIPTGHHAREDNN